MVGPLGILAGIIAPCVLLFISIHFLLSLLSPPPSDFEVEERNYKTALTSTSKSLPHLSKEPTLGLSVVVPAYNEDDRLGIMLDEVMEHLLSTSSTSTASAGKSTPRQANGTKLEKGSYERCVEEGVEVLVVDDGSTDKTTETALKLADKWNETVLRKSARKGAEKGRGVEIKVVTLRKNRGKGRAVQHGVNCSSGRLVLFADADGATRFSDIDDLLRGMDKIVDDEGHGIVIGSRAHLVTSDAVVKRSKLRNLLMHGFHLFLRTLGVGSIRDTQCGFKLFTRPSALLLFPDLHLPRWSFDVELLLIASLIKSPIPILEVPVAWHEVNGSKIRLGWDSIGMARDLLLLRGNLFTGTWIVPSRQAVSNGDTKVPNGSAKH